MAKNKNTLTNSDNRLIYVEPNCSDRGIPNPEDLSVFVSLTTISKNRSTLFNGEVTSTQGSSRPIGFIDGTNIGGARRSLTTNYTEISTTFTAKDKFGKEENDLETLGIESIDITFDTAYTPMIKIKFIDIRGNAVLSKGNDSKYKMFFDLPFPIFDLTVKGFYGKAVKYCLHLTKWNSSFNSSTGNFEIDTEFIGYTYALLTDCLLGYMRATALTNIGKRIFREYQQKSIKVGGRIVRKYPNLVTIDNLLKYIREIDSEFSKIKSTDENVKQINALDNMTAGLNDYKASINNFKKITIGTLGDGDLLKNNDDNLVLLPRRLYDLLTTPIDTSTEFVNSRLKTYKERQENLVRIINKPITPDLSFLKLKFVNVAVYNAVGYLASAASLNANGLPTLTEDTFQINPAVNNTLLWDNNAAKIIKDKLKELYKIKTNREKFVVFDFTNTYKEVKRVENLIKIRKKGLEGNLNQEIKNAVNKLSFKPTIRNIVNVLCIHAQVFLETLAQVSKNAEESESRKTAILKINEFKTSLNKSKTIYPWPEYRKNTNGILVESWIGASLTEDYNKVNEVVFVDELLQNLMKIAKQDEIRELTGSLDSPDFFPVSPAEAKVQINGEPSLITQNPYYQALKGEGTTGTHQEAIRCLLFRIFTAGGVSNRLALSPDYAKIIGQLEAENLFKVINTEFTPILKAELINAINNIGAGANANAKSENATKEVIKTWTKGGNIPGVKHPANRTGVFMKLKNNSYYYKYIISPTGTGPYQNSYIPISGGFHGKDFFIETRNTTNTASTYDFRTEIGLKVLSQTLIFTSDNIYEGGNNNQQFAGFPATDDGSFHLKILVDDDDNNSEFIIPSAQSAKLQEYKDKVGEDTVIDVTCSTNICDLKIATYNNSSIVKGDLLNRYNGIFNTLAIDSVLDNNKKTPVNASYFAKYNNSANRKKEVTGGFYLTSTPPSLTRAPGTTHNLNNEKLKTIKNEKYVGVFSSVSSNSIGLGGPIYNDYEWVNKLYVGNAPAIQNNKTSVTSLVTGTASASKIYAPIVDFTVMGDNSDKSLSLSLFGSKFYYAQDSLESKAFLYVNAIGWEGIVGDLISRNGDTDANASLFDLIDVEGSGVNDDTVTIKGLYGNNGSIISAPKLWCVYIGSLIWRFEEGGGGNNNLPDPIIWDTTDNKGAAVNPDMYSPDGRMFPLQTNKTYLPATDQYLHANTYKNTFGDDGNISSGIFLDMEIKTRLNNSDGYSYPLIDKIIRDFPEGVKTEFIRVFENFANVAFKEIAKNYELFKGEEDLKTKHKLLRERIGYEKSGSFSTIYKLGNGRDVYAYRLRYYDPIHFSTQTHQVPRRLYIKESQFKIILGSTDRNSWGNTFEEVLKNYDNVSPINDNEFHDEEAENSAGKNLAAAGNRGITQTRDVLMDTDNHFYFSQFDLTLADNDNNKDFIVSHFARTYSVINASPIIFRPIDDFKVTSVNTNNAEITIRGKKDYNKDGIRVSKKIFEVVLRNFFLRFEELSESTKTEDDKIQQRIFNNVDDDIIKLNIYRTLASINDKWLGSETGLACTNISEIVDSFRFLDTGFLDIGDDFLINPLSVSQKIIGNYNQSFFDLINSILIENNFNFIALPSFIDFTDAKKMKEDVFTPYAWSEKISESAAGASFICVYTGQKSSNLDLGKDAEHKDDGFTIISDNKCDEVTKTMSQPLVQPELFNKEKKQNGYNIPYFVVSYGKGNQSIFKDVKLDQREFTETAESLEIINDLSDSADKTKTSYKGQNLFNIYQKRAYSAEIEMMGNVTIQPMMYFQLNNIPMFKGAYLIYNTTHNITAHNMKTTFKGSRIKKVKTPLITEVQIFQTLIGSLKDGGKATRISDDNLSSGGTTFTGNITSTFKKSKFIKIRRFP